MSKIDIRTYSKEDLINFFVSQKREAFRGVQVYDWLWKKGVHSFDEMSNLSKELRGILEETFIINNAQVHKMQKSADGTIKNAIKLYDGLVVESVLIPTSQRTTACVSSQVGCSLDCEFCATATLKRQRNLTADEIFDQVKIMNTQSELYHKMTLKNIVFMGMGEPMMNYRHVMKAIEKITSQEGLHMSPSRITVSTSGIPKMITKMADEYPRFKLAVSLHSAVESTRNSIMPFTKDFPLKALVQALKYWYEKTKSKVTYEYIVWRGINDSDKEIKALVDFCKQLPCKVNLIEYNPIENSRFYQADDQIIEAYTSALETAKIIVKVRKSRGEDIDAACGQLVNKNPTVEL